MARSRKNRARGAAAARNPSNLTSGASRRANGPALHRRLRCEPLEDRRLLALITVTIADDSFDEADGFTSLREAIFAANTVPGDDEIRFDPGLFAAGARTILLTHGELAITEALTITGPGAELLKIDASGNDPTPNVNNADGSRIFNIQDGFGSLFEATISSLTLTGGDSAEHGGAILCAADLNLSNCALVDNSSRRNGGAVATTPETISRVLTVDGARFEGNVATVRGGGVFWSGPFSISASRLSGNLAARGGAAHLVGFGAVDGMIANCVINENAAGLGGGVYWNGRSLNVSDSTISGNSTRPVPDQDAANLQWGGGLFLRGQTATVSNSTISGNRASIGAGVNSMISSLTVRDSTIADNVATNRGGGISGGSVEILDSTIQNNSAGRSGGGISGGVITVRRSLVDGNSAGLVERPGVGTEVVFGGGGIFATSFVIDSSTISRNVTANEGGGIRFSSTPISPPSTITNSTLSGNAANQGGGIYLDFIRPLWIEHSTITENEATTNFGEPGRGGGIVAAVGVRESPLQLRNSIVAGNSTTGMGPDVSTSNSAFAHYSLIGDWRGAPALVEAPVDSPDANGNLIGGPVHGAIDPRLGPLANNGGPTLTHALLPGSPALDAGNPAGDGGAPEFDQRGAPFSRVVGARIDIGAVESIGMPIVVDTLVDESDGDYRRGDLSLREAIELANAQPGAEEIVFDPALFAAGPGTILLEHGVLWLRDVAAIKGPGATLLTIDAGGRDPNQITGSSVFFVSQPHISTSLSGMTLTGGRTLHKGGAVNAVGDLVLDSVIIRDNVARNYGGGVYALGRLTILDSLIVGNSSSHGGGIALGYYTSTALIQRSTIVANSAHTDGGGIHTEGPIEIDHSTLSTNQARSGGGIFYAGPNAGSIRSSVVTSNTATLAGGIHADYSRLTIDSSIVAANLSGRFVTDLVIQPNRLAMTYSLIGFGFGEAPVVSPDANGNLIGGPVHGVIDPRLGPLANNGGPTLTHALLPGSPALDAGNPAAVPGDGGASEFDQRGAPFTRLAGGRIDIGAFEVQAAGGAYFADFTLDGVTDGADFLVWQRNVGRTSGATLRQGDATADGDVDGNDLAVWRVRSEGGGEEAVGDRLSAFGQKITGQGGALQREATAALAGVREVGFGPARREEFEDAIVHGRDAAFAGTAAVIDGLAERTGETPVARGEGEWIAAAVDAAMESDETAGDSFQFGRLAE